ncbi:MAG: cupin domain-containing protein [Actinobacteria bacterium]|nr:cupin domain-containing protein [Actinomycetota bacterium]
MKLKAEDIIRILGLEYLQNEGGYFRETYRSSYMADFIGPDGRKERKAVSTAIYYLITPQSFSHLQMIPQDEIFHFYMGDPAEMLLLYDDGRYEIKILGQDLFSGQHMQVIVPGRTWQAFSLIEGGDFALLGTTVAPAFENSDFFSAKDFKNDFLARFSQIQHILEKYI